MFRKVGTITLMVLLMCISTVVGKSMAEFRIPDKEPDSFRNLKFGFVNNMQTGYEVIQSEKDVRMGDVFGVWKKKSEKLSIGDAKIEGIDYYTYNGKLYRVVIKCTNWGPDAEALDAIFKKVYGPVSYEGREGRKWIGKSVDIHMMGSRIIEYKYKPILNEINAKLENLRKNAADDL